MREKARARARVTAKAKEMHLLSVEDHAVFVDEVHDRNRVLRALHELYAWTYFDE